MIIKVFNTLSRKEEVLETMQPDHLKMYVCGPTVYDRPHLGNARSAVVYDMFYRFFQRIYKKVTFVRNITDVDDKINTAAKARQISIKQLTQEITNLFHQDTDVLNILRPTHEPRATDHIAQMIVMIEELLKNRHAYISEGHVLFDVKSYQDYGALSRRSLDEMISGARVEVASYKKNPLDFVLWKPANADDDASSIFESPWGKGRPGWHIECSAMSRQYLGDDFDFHGGGADLQFPHHENEIAQSRCSKAQSHYANYWIHNGFLTVNGEKMSKSLKNFITVYDLLQQNIKGVVIRYLLLATHYRKPFDYNQKALEDAQKSIDKFYAIFDENDLLEYRMNKLSSLDKSDLMTVILEYLADDLNIAKVFAHLHKIVAEIQSEQLKLTDFINNMQNQSPQGLTSDDQNKKSQKKLKNQKQDFIAVLDFLGLIDDNYFINNLIKSVDENYINEQIQLRANAKVAKDWAVADKIRKDLLEKNIILEDKATGTSWKITK